MSPSVDAIPDEQLLEMYRQMLTIRVFEQRVMACQKKGLNQGTAHAYIGMEAVAVGICAALRKDDMVTSTHRGHGHCIARGLEPKRMLAEIFGRSTGYCGGKGGSMHIADVKAGMLGADGIVGGGIPIAVGAALGCRVLGLDRVVACFFGEGAANQGSFHEAINFSAVQNLANVFVCENNYWALSADFESTTAVATVADRAAAYSIPGIAIDGNDVQAVLRTASECVDRARNGGGPSLIECRTYRWEGHSIFPRPDPRAEEDIESWKKRDPIVRVRIALLENGSLDPAADEALLADIEALIDDAEAFAADSPMPEAAAAMKDIYV